MVGTAVVLDECEPLGPLISCQVTVAQAWFSNRCSKAYSGEPTTPVP
jgi:hypothetical protein